MAISLQKGGNVNLSKEAPGLSKIVVGLGWDVRTTDGNAFDLASVPKRLARLKKDPWEGIDALKQDLDAVNEALAAR